MPDNFDYSLTDWPIFKQIKSGDLYGLDGTASSKRSDNLIARTTNADRVTGSICPYCAVGCGQLVYVKNEKIIDIEGDPASPISHGCLCPKGAATFQLVTGSHRLDHVLYRRPHGTAVGAHPARAGDGHGGRPREVARAMPIGRIRTRTGIRFAALWQSLISAAPRSTTKRTTSSRNFSLASA